MNARRIIPAAIAVAVFTPVLGVGTAAEAAAGTSVTVTKTLTKKSPATIRICNHSPFRDTEFVYGTRHARATSDTTVVVQPESCKRIKTDDRKLKGRIYVIMEDGHADYFETVRVNAKTGKVTVLG